MAAGRVWEERAWLARVRTGPAGWIRGAGFAVDGEHLVTCAHVVREAGADGPGQRVFVDFPLLTEAGCWAAVVAEGWAEEAGSAGDTALLRLENPPTGLVAVPVRAVRSLHGQAFTAYGFPQGYDDGVASGGRLGLAVGREWVQLEVASNLLVEPGYSGGAVWSEDLCAVVALLTTRDTGTAGRVAFAVPIPVLAGRSDVVAAALPTPLDLDPARDIHWGPRSRGLPGVDGNGGWLFSGRRQVLAELVAWLTVEGVPSQRVVTGTPGSGKSAVLARLVTAADRHYRRRIPDLVRTDPGVPPPGSVDVTFYARGGTVPELVSQVARVLDLPDVTGPEQLRAELASRPGLRLVVDAVDEADQPQEIARLLTDLSREGTRVLVGCRDHLLANLDDPEPIWLNQPPYLQHDDVQAYVTALLQQPAAPGRLRTDEDGYRRGGTTPLAAEIAEAAAGNFLVAQLLAQAVRLSGDTTRPFPHQVWQAFDRLLDALPHSQQTRDLLLPLAYAYGDGLPAGPLWLTATAALRRAYQQADLEDLLAGPAASFLTTALDSDQGRRYRLFHQALGEALTRIRDPAADAQRLWSAWTSQLLPTTDGQRRWVQAPAYLRSHAAEHATAAGQLTSLLDDPDYLLAADPARLLRALPAVGSAPPVADVYRIAYQQLLGQPEQERASHLELVARSCGLGQLAANIAQLPIPNRRWSCRWLHVHQPSPHVVLGMHPGAVEVVSVISVTEPSELGDRLMEGKWIVLSGGYDGSLQLWDLEAAVRLGKPVPAYSGSVFSIALGRLAGTPIVVSAGDDEYYTYVQVRQLPNWEQVRKRELPNWGQVCKLLRVERDSVRSVAFVEVDNAAVIVCGTTDGRLRWWDPLRDSAGSIGEPMSGHRGCVTDLADATWRPNRPTVISAGDDGTIRIWELGDDLTDGRQVRELKGHEGPVRSVAVTSRAGRPTVVSAGDDGTIRIWELGDDLTDGRQVRELKGHEGPVRSVAVTSRAGRPTVVSAGDDGTVRAWDLTDGRHVGPPHSGHARQVRDLTVTPAGDPPRAVSAGDDGTIRVWDLHDRDTASGPAQNRIGWVSSVDTTDTTWVDGRPVAVSAGHDATVRVWNLDNGDPACPPLTGHAGPVLGISVVSGLVVSAGDDATIRVWNLWSYEPVGVLEAHDGPVWSVAAGLLRDRPTAVSVGNDGTIRCWDLRERRQIHPSPGKLGGKARTVALGRLDRIPIAVVGVEHWIQLWDLQANEPYGDPLGRHTGWVKSVTPVFTSSNGRRLAVSGGDDGMIRIWDLVKREQVGRPLEGHAGWVEAVAVRRLDRGLVGASGGNDATVRIWNLETSSRDDRFIVDSRSIQITAPVLALKLESPFLLLGTGQGVIRLDFSGWSNSTPQSGV